jgi:RNA polymerase sigma-70 factor, ECF subfamily
LDFVYRVCFRYAGSKSDAEDLAHETFLKASRGLSRFRGDSGEGTWLYRLAANTCLDYLRKRKRENRNLADFLDSMVLRNLDETGDRISAKLELERILGHVRPTLRTILFLALAEGLSYPEVAEVLNISPSAVAKSVSRFLIKHRKREGVPSGPQLTSRETSQHA